MFHGGLNFYKMAISSIITAAQQGCAKRADLD
jgi:hypothetical protein